MVFITKLKELFSGELHTVVRDDGVRYSKAMDDVEKEQHSLLGFDCGYWPSFNPFCELVYGDKHMAIAPGRLLERPNQIEPPDRKGPHDGDHLECLGRKVSLSSVVLAPFTGAYNLLSVSYYSGLVEALSECIPNQGSRHSMVTVDPTLDIARQKFPYSMGIQSCRISVWLYL